ncbi:hypothetical protein K6V98_05130 [Collinsella sp. AGMB00827]|uniref:Uncharacterized protein n=1 Tax=Collinsella ureilytica TaxID=2869515 RepID=A0ABS7ML15_9ACTN|nr:hypothetical protein [Collinsella urealyticum]MBY4797738.1 hypothetical protein [Collinsella urealyticum]
MTSVRSCHGNDLALLFEFALDAIGAQRNIYTNEKTGVWTRIQKHMPDVSGLAKEAIQRLSNLDCTSC